MMQLSPSANSSLAPLKKPPVTSSERMVWCALLSARRSGFGSDRVVFAIGRSLYPAYIEVVVVVWRPMQGTSLVYSSHDRSEYLHNHFIVQRALRGRENKRIFFLPMSEYELHAQEFSWDRFAWYFRFYERHGLEAFPFYYRDGLAGGDVQLLWSLLWSSEVVILGGGGPATGMHRYRSLGASYDGEPGKFGRFLHERRKRGLLTVGFSAGADQLCERMFRDFRWPGPGHEGFGLVRHAMV